MKNKKYLSSVNFESQKKKDMAFSLLLCLTFLVTLYLIITKL
jgi:hypothetical protein